MSGFDLHVQWRSALSADSAPYYFPDRFTPYFRKNYSVSAVYRWRVMRVGSEMKERIYIGEAEHLVTRIQRVRTPSRKAKEGDTNKRLNKLFTEYLSEGRKIVLDIADIEPFEVNSIRFDHSALGHRFRRRALENLLLAIAEVSGDYELLNIVIDPVEKARRALARLPASAVREIIKRYGLSKA